MPFEKVRKKLGFGCMRMKTVDGRVDYPEFCRMIDAFMEAGFTYFDTAHGYLHGQSETAIRDCLVARYPRDSFVLANKLSSWCFEKEEDILPFFENQLTLCGVDYFDFYLCHAVNRDSYLKYRDSHAFEIIKSLKEQGKIRHVAMSFHDTADVLDRILAEQPYMEAVQLQINYLDYDDPGVQSKACYDVAVKHGKKVIVMEPVKGGYLANLPQPAAEIFEGLNGGSHASYALRFAASFPEVALVLSGMGDLEMVQDNMGTFSDFVPLSEAEFAAAERARAIIRKVRQLPCTDCRYCTDVCPQKLPIPTLFSLYNQYLSAKITKGEAKKSFPQDQPLAGDCIRCGKCEKNCPQNIEIQTHLQKIAKW